MTRQEKKDNERRALDAIYKRRFFVDVVPTETPDFLLYPTSSELPIGVEVVELYESDTHARIQNNPDYIPKILSGLRRPDKNDQEILALQDLTVIRHDPSTGGDVRAVIKDAIIYEIPSLAQYAETIEGRMDRKAQQYDAYRRRCCCVDLLIQDRGEIINSLDSASVIDQLLRHLRGVLIQTPFREVNFVTTTASGECCVPLKGSLFVREIHCMLEGLREWQSSGAQIPQLETVDAIRSYLWHRGIGSADASFEGREEISYGGWSVSFDSEYEMMSIDDNTHRPWESPVGCAPTVQLPQDVLDFLVEFSEKNLVGGLELHLKEAEHC